MTSPFPFTRTFLEKAVTHLRETVLKEDYERLEELRAHIIDRYSKWAEEKLKDCPMFMRRYTNKVAYVHTEPNGYGGTTQEKSYIPCTEGVPLVPGYCDNETVHIPLQNIKGIQEECTRWLRLKTKLNAVTVASDNKWGRRGFYQDGLRYERASDGWVLIGLPKYAEDLEPLVKQYAEDVMKDVDDLINSEPPIPEEEPETTDPETTEEITETPEIEEDVEITEPETETTGEQEEIQEPEEVPEPEPEEEKTAPAEETVTETKKKSRKKASEPNPFQLEFCF